MGWHKGGWQIRAAWWGLGHVHPRRRHRRSIAPGLAALSFMGTWRRRLVVACSGRFHDQIFGSQHVFQLELHNEVIGTGRLLFPFGLLESFYRLAKRAGFMASKGGLDCCGHAALGGAGNDHSRPSDNLHHGHISTQQTQGEQGHQNQAEKHTPRRPWDKDLQGLSRPCFGSGGQIVRGIEPAN